MWRTITFLILAGVIIYFAAQYEPNWELDLESEVATSTSTVQATSTNTNNATGSIKQTNGSTNSTQSKLMIEDIKKGTGKEAKTGNTVSVHYVGTLTNGTKFDSSRDRGQAFTFSLGAGDVIKGWDQGVVGMKVGGLRKLTIPPDLGYGAIAYGPIPANSTLVFEIELLDVK